MATANFRYIGPFSGYQPQTTLEVVAWIMKESEFSFNKYIQYIPAPAKSAFYTVVEQDAPVRQYDDAMLGWADGASRKQMGADNKVAVQEVPFRTFRRNRSWTLGWQTIEQTEKFGTFKIKVIHIDTTISQMMVNRAVRIVALIETVANYPAANVRDVNTLNGGAGKWSMGSDDPASPNYNAIFKTLLAGSQYLALQTNNKVRPRDLKVVLSPGAAIKIAATSELTNYCRQGQYSKDILEKGLDPQWEQWGLPSRYKTFEFCVEDTPRVSQQAQSTATGAQATANRAFIKADTSAALITRKGGITAEYGGTNLSSLQLYHFGPLMKIAAFDDPEDELVRGHASEDTKEIMIASGASMGATVPAMLLTNLI
ncbi:MAG TPA: hypothetical protein VG099_24650 [Gemmataceae bacterium]|jgi:hypothetical protein|nr:hypothetical protein [Gemmataceae bacterium]